MRPRDVIHLCNLCCDTAENNGHPVITEADVSEAVEQYSQWKLEDSGACCFTSTHCPPRGCRATS
ncbi:MAG: hypothetical protein ACRDP6_23805 [Actinoallomurus sp.]